LPYLKYQNHNIYSREGENVLDALLRHGISIPFSCRHGVCHVCLQRCIQGTVPQEAQRGLRRELREQGYFMPCKCVPLADMEFTSPTALYTTAIVHSKEMFSPDVCKLLLEPTSTFVYRAGQFINLRRPDGLIRSYSLASLPVEDDCLEIHVQRKNGGIMSNWILDELSAGDELDIQGPSGEFYYKDDAHSHSLLLVGTGTGLSPLFGIIRDALHNQHEGEIHLYHGGSDADQFYLREKLRQMERQYTHFHYQEWFSDKTAPVVGALAGRASELASVQHKDLRGWHVYLAGQVEMVDRGEHLAAARGAAPNAIHTGAFALRELRNKQRNGNQPTPTSVNADKAKYPPPDPELWAALHRGELLIEVLKDFYGRVYQDERLASFFVGVTKQRLIEKQFLFMRQILTGEKIYFGDRPRNSHHWMVISGDLFDYRSELMVTCLREHGLPQPMVQRFSAIEEFYRHDIVKSAPFPRFIGDMERPLEGFGEITMDVGTLCDTCGREVAVGEKIIYHVRLGKIYCSDCSSQHNHEVPQAPGA
jgi:ferredoxin-NADP reductase/ferredoxin/truncated hemoglobin YjbI